MEKLRVGVIGLGAFGERHIQAYQGLPYVEVVAVASRSVERARQVSEQYDIPRWWGSYQPLIDDPSIQAVSVATAETDHREPVVAALEAGKHVLVEKPIASTLEDALAMTEAARRTGKILMLGHLLRFETKYAALKHAIASGGLGRLVAVSARRNRRREQIANYDRVHPVLTTGIHDIDIMLWFTGDRVRQVRAIDRLARRDDGAHGLWALLEFESGIVGMLETVWLLPASAGLATDDAFEAIGLEGTAKIQFDHPSLQLWGTDQVLVPDTSYDPLIHGSVGGALREELAYFARCVLRNSLPDIVTPEDGLNALAVAQALIESARRGSDVTVRWPDEARSRRSVQGR